MWLARSDRAPRGDMPPQLRIAGSDWPVLLIRHAAARSYRLRLDAARGEIRLTLPARASAARALRWAAEQQDWLAARAAEAVPPVVVGDGSLVPLRGSERRIVWDARAPRRIRDDGVALHVGGPAEQLSARVGRWLKAEALTLLTQESRDIAGAAGLPLRDVRVGDPRSRWGSCAGDGTIRYNWRLILAPDHVRRATVAHEVAHLKHMDHSPAFHALVDALHDGDVAEARAWLRHEGRALHRYRFG